MKLLTRFAALVLVVALVGCGKGDPAAEANKNLKPIDPNAPKPVAAAGAGAGGGAEAPTANVGAIK